MPGDPTGNDGVVHPVQTTQEGGFAAAGRADEGDDFVGADVEADLLQRVFLAVIDIDFAADHFRVVRRDPADGLPVVVVGDLGAGQRSLPDIGIQCAIQGGLGFDRRCVH